jgi:glycosyltransferase involved in cell wall biosynthesis
MKDLPVFSVVIATHNRKKYLARMLDKLLQEDYPNLEVIVVDGGSGDGTVEMLKSYGSKISRWISEPDDGEYFAYNKGISLASGDLLKLMSDDDILRHGVFRKVGDYFLQNQDIEIVFGQTALWREVNSELTLIGETDLVDPSKLSLRNWLRATQQVRSMAAFLRSSVFHKIGLFETKYACGDMEFWMRAASRGIRMGIFPETVIDYYYTGQNTVTRKKNQIATDMVEITSLYGNRVDVLLTMYNFFIRNTVLPQIGRVSHALNFHPLRYIHRWRAKRSLAKHQ